MSTIDPASASRARRPITVRMSPGGLAEVDRLAAIETEGNASQMVRKLLGEALAARSRPPRR